MILALLHRFSGTDNAHANVAFNITNAVIDLVQRGYHVAFFRRKLIETGFDEQTYQAIGGEHEVASGRLSWRFGNLGKFR